MPRRSRGPTTREIAPELFLAQATERELFFGFDCGDAIRLGTITQSGLRLDQT